MSKRAVAKWIEINIGDSTNSGSDTILRYALGGVDVTYDGNVYKADGNLTSIGDIEQSLGFRKTSLVIKFNSTNLINLAHVNARKYRNKSVKVWIGRRGTDGSITTSSIKQIFGGQCDTHDVNRKTISIKAQAFWSRFEQPSGARTSSAAQAYNIRNGVYTGVATTAVDKGFDLTDVDYSNLTLGKVPARSVEHSQRIKSHRGGFFGTGSWRYKTIVTTEFIPGREGEQLSDSGSDYTRPIVFGRAYVGGNILHALNPTQAKIDSVYPTMSSSAVIAGTTEDTKYVTTVFAVAEGPVNDISVMFNDLAGTATLDAFALGDNDTGTIKNSDGEVIGIIETKLGSPTQTAFTNLVSLSPVWTTDHKCYGTALVMITLAASDAYGEGFPDFTFNIGGKQHPQVAVSGSNYSLGTNTYGNTGTSSSVFDRADATTSYTITSPTTTNVVNSASPAYAILDVLLNKSYGLGKNITASDIDLKSFYDANSHEIDQSTVQGGEYPTVCRGVLNGAKSFKENLDALLSVAKANLTVVDGKITLVSNRYLGTDTSTRSAVKTFDEGNIINGIMNIKFAPSNRVFNEITITVPVSNSLNAEPFSLTVEDANALAEDDGQKSEKIMTLPMASVQYNSDGVPDDKSREVVEEIGRFALRRSRLFGRGSFDVDYWDNSTLKPGDVINVSSKRYNRTGSDSILAKVTKILFKKNGTLSLEWSEYSNLIYDVSQTDITSVSRGSFPATAFNTPPNYDIRGPDGLAGFSNALVRVFKKASTEPTDKPTVAGRYTFSTGVLFFNDGSDNYDQTVSNGWHTSADAATGTGTLYARLATVVSRGDTDDISATEWSGVNEVTSTGVDGDDGINSAIAAYYQRTESKVAPSVLPQSDSSFEFSTSNLNPNPNSGWGTLRSITGDGGYLWFTTATAAARTSTDIIEASEWSEPVLFVENGTKGNDGLYSRRVYQNSEDRPSISGGAINLFTRVLTPPTNWSVTPTSGDPQRWFSETEIDPNSIAGAERTTLQFNGVTGGTNVPAVKETTRITLGGTQAGNDSASGGALEETDISFDGTAGSLGVTDLGTIGSLLGGSFVATNDIVDNGSIIMAVGDDGKLATVPSGGSFANANQTQIQSSVSTDLEGVAYSDTLGLHILVGRGGVIFTTDDEGVTLTSQTSGTTQTLARVFWSGTHSKFVIGGGSGTILTSSDGVTWTSETSNSTVFLDRASISDSGTVIFADVFGSVIVRSTNLTDWSEITFSSTQTARDIAYGGDKWVIALTNSSEQYIVSTDDGLTFGSEQSIGGSETSSIGGVTYSNGLWFMARDDTVYSYSVDNLSSWTTVTSGGFTNNDFPFLARASNGYIYWSDSSRDAARLTVTLPAKVTVTVDSTLSSSPIIGTFTSGAFGTTLDSQFKGFLDAAITATTLTGVTTGSITDATKVTATVAQELVDMTVTVEGRDVTPTVIVQEQGVSGTVVFKTSYRIDVGGSHSPASFATSFANDLLIADCRTQVRNNYINDISGFDTPTVIGSNDFFDVNNSIAGPDTDMVFTITQIGTGGDITGSASVQTQGAGPMIVDTNELDITIDGVEYTIDYEKGEDRTSQVVTSETFLESKTVITDDYDILKEPDGKLVIEAKEFGSKQDITAVMNLVATGQTATSPTVSIVQGKSATLIWSTPEKDGVNGDTPIIVEVDIGPDQFISQLPTGFYPTTSHTVKATFYHGEATPTVVASVDTISVSQGGALIPATGDSSSTAVTIDGASFVYDVDYTTVGDNLRVDVIVKTTGGVGIATGTKTLALVKLGPDGAIGPRTVNGTVYYSVAQSSAPSTPSAATYNFTSRAFTGLTTNWSKDPTTVVASQTNTYYQATYEIVENTFGGTYTITFGTPSELVSFTGIITQTLTATQSITVGTLVTNTDATVQSGAGAKLKGNGDFTVGNSSKNIVWDSSEGTFTVNGTIIAAGNILLDGTSLVGNSDGSVRVGSIYDTQIITTNSQTISVDQSGSTGSSGGSIGGNGGNGTSFTLTVTGNINVSSLDVSGGDGGDASSLAGIGGAGGNSGNVALTSTHGDIIITSLNARGGFGGSASLTGESGNGGNVSLTANSGCVSGTGNVSVAGGPGGSTGTVTLSFSVGNNCAGQ